MGKAPADQFYYSDWSRDVELQQTCACTKGVWMNALARMWFAKPRGELRGTRGQLAKLCVCTIDELDTFLKDAFIYDFCDLLNNNQSVRKTLGITELLSENNAVLTLRNRRMFRAEKKRESNRLRQQRYYGKHKPNDETNRESNAGITLPSSSASPIIKEKYSCDSKEMKLSKYLLRKICENNPQFKEPDLETWAKYMDLILRVDKREYRQVVRIIKLCQQDDFWSGNILSTRKLREKFDQLVMKLKEKPKLRAGIQCKEVKIESDEEVTKHKEQIGHKERMDKIFRELERKKAPIIEKV